MLYRRLLCLTAVLFSGFAFAEEWPGWRGPRGDGTSQETGIPTRWSRTENVAWKVDVPGKGHSSPVVWGDRIFLTTCLEKEEQRVLLCLDRRDGKLLWQKVVLTAPLERKHKLNSYASSTPATDGKHVWVSFLDAPNIVVACYDVAGQEVWRTSPGTFFSVHGFCSPPILYKDTVILNADQDGDGYLVALDKLTGHGATARGRLTFLRRSPTTATSSWFPTTAWSTAWRRRRGNGCGRAASAWGGGTAPRRFQRAGTYTSRTTTA
jgi:outer membrane protein assembly factor BamB